MGKSTIGLGSASSWFFVSFLIRVVVATTLSSFSLSSFYPQVVISFSVSQLNSRILKYLHVNPLKSYMYISEVFARELHLIGGIQIFIDIVFYSDFVFKFSPSLSIDK